MSDETFGLLVIASVMFVFAWWVRTLWSDSHVDDFPIDE